MGPRCACALVLLVGSPGLAAIGPADATAWANRLTWGASARLVEGPQPGSDRWLDEQLLHPRDELPSEIAAQIASMQISKKSVAELMVEQDAAGRAANALMDPVQRDAARRAHNEFLNGLMVEAASRSLLRDIYAHDQLREQLTWFWVNHFNVLATKSDIRATVGDYEEVIRGRSLGKFRDLLEATLKHPAMLRYLDNDQNAANRVNENYAREIMELHTMGVGSGYSQKDVQELARVLTGVGVDIRHDPPKISAAHQALYVREGVFSFNPDRHDFGDKQFLGQTIKGSGFGEVEQALDLIARSPATAHHVSRELATYFTGDAPPDSLVEKMARAWRKSDGDIAAVMRTMIRAREFRQSLGTAIKDPVHYVVSATRLMYGDQTIVNTQPLVRWLNRMGEGLYAHETPDGYSLASAAWTGPGQMMTRFESAQQMAYNPGIFTAAPASPAVQMAAGVLPVPQLTVDRVAPSAALPPPPDLRNSPYYRSVSTRLGERTKAALAQAKTLKQWNALFLSSPEFMRR